MSSSFADQLLKAGLVNQEDISKAEEEKKQRAAKRKAQRAAKANAATAAKQGGKRPAKKPKPAPKSDGTVANSAASKMLGTTKDIAEAQQKKKQQQEFAEQRRVMNIQINELLKDQPIEEPSGDTKFSYVYDGKVRSIYVSEEQQKKLSAADVALTVVKAKTKIIPIALVEPLQKIDPKRFIHIVKDDKPAADDPYAGFEVPDDITW